MDVTVVLEQRFFSTPDGHVWTESPFTRRFWARYLTVFDSVRVVARVRPVATAPPKASRIDGPTVSVTPLPYYVGPAQFLAKLGPTLRTLRNATDADGAVIYRIPSTLANIAQWGRRPRRPFGVEVVGDPWDTFSAGASVHPLRPLLREWFYQQQRTQCATASACSYVTKHTLQRRYPAHPSAVTVHASSVDLDPSAFAETHRTFSDIVGRPARLVTVGMLEHLYKGPDTLLQSVARCVDGGVSVELTMVGGGRLLPRMKALAHELKIEGFVTFKGSLPFGDAVVAELEKADVFVLPSRQEGLPRAMIEAMARALPCIGSNVGGIPELLDEQYCLPPNDPVVLASCIQRLLRSPHELETMSRRNLDSAADYASSILQARRDEFYKAVYDATIAWRRARRGA